MRVKIYQINMDRDADNAKFMGTDARKSLHLKEAVDPGIYDEVFNAEIKETDRGHSLSVSDVVVTDQGAYFCDSIGFKKIPFDESKTQKPANLMRVVYVEPGEKPYTAEILHTLQAEQKAVGGLIEPIYNEDDTILVGNEESKLMGMQGNRRIGDGSSIIAGPFFVCGDTGEDFRSLTDSEVDKYMDRFAEPEDITDEEVQRDTGFAFFFGM